jgi:hypothetical protein
MFEGYREPGVAKKAVFFGLLGLGMIAVLEGASFLALTIRDGGLPSFTLWRQQREKAVQESGGPIVGGRRANPGMDASGMQVIHPFVGFVLNPAFKGVNWREVTSQGFQRLPGEIEPPASASRFVVAVFGGSQLPAAFVYMAARPSCASSSAPWASKASRSSCTASPWAVTSNRSN